MEYRPGLKEDKDKAKRGFSGPDHKIRDRKTMGVFILISILAHGLCFSAILFFHHIEINKPVPKVVRVDLVSFVPSATGPVSQPVKEPVSQSPDMAGGIPTKTAPDLEEIVPDPVASPEPEPLAMLKPDVSLKAKPKNLKDILAAKEKQRNQKKSKKKTPRKKLKPKVDAEKVLKEARQKIAQKIDAQKEQQIATALKRIQESVETRGDAAGADGPNQYSGAVSGKKGYKPIDLYKMVLQSAIEQNWVFNDVLAQMDQTLQVRILIKILKSGEIRDITYETRSGNRYLDESAKKAIKRANPLPELPQGMRSYDVVVIFTPKGLK